MRLWILGLLLARGCLTSPGDTSTVDVSPWWPEAEHRLQIWLTANPQCDYNYINPVGKVRIRVDTLTPNKPCYYRASIDTIVYDERWLDGRMAHELGHAALDMAGNNCYHDFEHK
jgi:hypothetical protein